MITLSNGIVDKGGRSRGRPFFVPKRTADTGREHPRLLGDQVLVNGVNHPMVSSAPDKTLRRAILDTARAVVLEQGYQALSMRRIARTIGYSATSIYLHFEGKDALLHALIEEGMQRLGRVLKRAAASDGTPVMRLQRVCEAYVRFGLRNPEYYEIMFMLHPEHMKRFPPEKYRRARRNLEIIGNAIRDASSNASASADELLMRASAVWASLHGAVSLIIARRIDAKITRKELVERVVKNTVRGLGFAA